MQQEWLENELNQQNSDAIRDHILRAFGKIAGELNTRKGEIEFLKAASFPNPFAMSCLVTIEKLSRELISQPVLTAILNKHGSEIQSGNYLLNFLDKGISPLKFFYDFFQTSADSLKVEKSAVQKLSLATTPLGIDGFFIKAPGSTGPTKLENWMDLFREFRNQLMHGRLNASTEQANFVYQYFEIWIGLMNYAIKKYELTLTSGLQVSKA
ncbi:MAG: hypothetical protein EOP04_08840 [Proteobacteria bacterium]|nr:MAG: hypothetical protein EOP04_08840 [Pseudomonadota bacterium]